ncbi:uncharacterized protein LOC103953107 isoform X2 [Pyrus x bretschneideri]|uniref:uncharacterized protein LOC103953107 isoform X2 n=1 Tax=Pyrus x bretschneideri TaxID=225117 RepID=UPI00202F2C99|nr:uncharacterized protein LOC103953107 isoform X2 [Pyrus x bretschneideri]
MQTLIATGSCFLCKFPNNNANWKHLLPSARRPSCNLRNQSTTRNSSLRTTWPSISFALFASGFFLGPLIDGLHSRVDLVVYENGSTNIGPLHTNVWVPVLLGLFYCTVGMFQLVLDERTSSKVQQVNQEKAFASLLTWFGFLLASVIGLGCPVAEIPLMQFFHLWYYPQANVEIFGQGLVSWTLTCYFVYTLFLINFSRWLKSVIVDAADTEDKSS